MNFNFRTLVSGFIATYLAVSPCLIFDHHAHAESDNHHAVEKSHSHSHDHNHSHDHGHNHVTHGDNSSEHSHDDEHCCDDLTSFLHAPIKEVPTAALVAVVPTNQVIIPYVHTKLHTALSRDGPIFESAREFATTTVIRV